MFGDTGQCAVGPAGRRRLHRDGKRGRSPTTGFGCMPGGKGHGRTSKRRRSPQTESPQGSERRPSYINIRSWDASQARKSLSLPSKQRAAGPNPAWNARTATERSSLLPKSPMYSPCQQAGQGKYHQPAWTVWREPVRGLVRWSFVVER